jgi:hypothetical protein
MRAHLPTCKACRSLYERHLMLSQLDPQALSAEQRIARGLGLRMPANRRRYYWSMGLALPLAVAACLALLSTTASEHAGGVAAGSDFAARGSEQRGGLRAPAFWTYRVNADGAPELIGHTIGAHDELAFAYANPTGEPYLMIFGVDEHRHVYWFHPSWPTGQPAPAAIHAISGSGPHELSEAIRHALNGRQLTVYALLCERPITATTIESWAAKAQNLADPQTITECLAPLRRALQVSP